jgi:hypothetical protein
MMKTLLSHLLIYALLSTQLAQPIALAEESGDGGSGEQAEATSYSDFELFKHMADNYDAESDASYAMASADIELNGIAAAGSQLSCTQLGDTPCESYPLFLEASKRYVSEMVNTSKDYRQDMETAATQDTGSGNEQIETAERAAALAAAKERAGMARLKLKKMGQGLYDAALAAAVDEYAKKEERLAAAKAAVKAAQEEVKAAKQQVMMAALALAAAVAMKMMSKSKCDAACLPKGQKCPEGKVDASKPTAAEGQAAVQAGNDVPVDLPTDSMSTCERDGGIGCGGNLYESFFEDNHSLPLPKPKMREIKKQSFDLLTFSPAGNLFLPILDMIIPPACAADCPSKIMKFIKDWGAVIMAAIMLLMAMMKLSKAKKKLKKAKAELEMAKIHTHMSCSPPSAESSASNETDIATNSNFRYFAEAKGAHATAQVEAFPLPKTRMEYLQGVVEKANSNVANTEQAVKSLTAQKLQYQQLATSMRQKMIDSTEAGQGGESADGAEVKTAANCPNGNCTVAPLIPSSVSVPPVAQESVNAADQALDQLANGDLEGGDCPQCAIRLKKFRKKRLGSADALRSAAGKGPTNLLKNSRELMAAINKRAGFSSKAPFGFRGTGSLPKISAPKTPLPVQVDTSLDDLFMGGDEEEKASSSRGSSRSGSMLLRDHDEMEEGISSGDEQMTPAEMAQEYDINTIEGDKSASIFEIITLRYLRTALPVFYSKKKKAAPKKELEIQKP